jgi:hypothetical protein
MKANSKLNRILAASATLIYILCFGGVAFALDDGARAYWKAKEGTNVASFQFLPMNIDNAGSQQFAPGQYIYPNSDVDANIVLFNWIHHFTLLDRSSSFNLALPGGNVDASVNTSNTHPNFLPSGVTPLNLFNQSSSGFGDPAVQLTVGLLGAPPLKSNVDLLNYEPRWTLDIATMLAFPIGEYDSDQLVNMGQNRWYGRVALPATYHFGTFSPGYMSSLEIIPSVWLFGENDDFLGQTLENDPLWQLEAHLTHDFTQKFYGSLDMLYRGGFKSKIDGVNLGDKLDTGGVGITMNYQVSDNAIIKAGYSADVFGDSNLDTSMIRIGFVYIWNKVDQNAKKLQGGH